MTFWIIISALALLVGALLAQSMLRGRLNDEHPAAFDLRVYRDQLKEVDRDAARGVIGAEDAERIRTEVSRRILAADAQLQAAMADGPEGAQTNKPRLVPLVLAAAVVAGGVALYAQLGAPGYGDLGLKARIAQAEEFRATRPAQASAEAEALPAMPSMKISPEYKALVEKLRVAVAARPDDLQGQMLLARNEAAMGNFKAAYQAQEQVISIKGDGATGQDYLDYADMMILAAGGYVSPEAERVLRAALARDPNNGGAQYYMGLMAAQTGRPDQAFRLWNALLRTGPADAPWIGPIREQIEEMAVRAGETRFALPPLDSAPQAPLAGPTAEDMQNAAQMSQQDRQEMIRSMVDRLAERLGTEGGSPAEWARLIGALGVLGDTQRAAAIWAEAQTVFADVPGVLDQLRAAAIQAGVAE